MEDSRSELIFCAWEIRVVRERTPGNCGLEEPVNCSRELVFCIVQAGDLPVSWTISSRAG